MGRKPNADTIKLIAGVTLIRQVTAGKVSDYLVHRRTKNAREPEPQTLNRENTVLRQLLAYAAIQAWLPEKVIVPHINQSLPLAGAGTLRLPSMGCWSGRHGGASRRHWTIPERDMWQINVACCWTPS